jgi:hypothetical protein
MTKTRELAGRRIPAADTHVPLARYDAACRALVEAKSVDEVMAIRDLAEAMRAYARQAQNKELEVDAAEIRLRAERRLGDKIGEQKATVGLNTCDRRHGPAVVPDDHRERPRLADAGITKDLSSKAQKLAALPDETFETLIAEYRERVLKEGDRVRTKLLRAKQDPPKPEPIPASRDDYELRCCSMRELLIDADLPDSDAIITDPPYLAEYLPISSASWPAWLRRPWGPTASSP